MFGALLRTFFFCELPAAIGTFSAGNSFKERPLLFEFLILLWCSDEDPYDLLRFLSNRRNVIDWCVLTLHFHNYLFFFFSQPLFSWHLDWWMLTDLRELRTFLGCWRLSLLRLDMTVLYFLLLCGLFFMASIDIIYVITLFACLDFRLCRWSESTGRYAHISYPTKSPDTFPLQRLNVLMKITKKVPFLYLLGALYAQGTPRHGGISATLRM